MSPAARRKPATKPKVEPVVENDPLTGLPPLYDDLFWRVSPTSAQHFWQHSTISDNIQPAAFLQVVKPNQEVKKFEKRKKFLSGRTHHVEVTVIEDVVLFEAPVTATGIHEVLDPSAGGRRFPGKPAEKEKYTKALSAAIRAAGRTAVRGARSVSYDYGFDVHVYDVFLDPTVNPASILRTARELHKEVEEQRLREVKVAEAKRQAEHAAKIAELERQRLEEERNRWVGDYPPRQLIQEAS